MNKNIKTINKKLLIIGNGFDRDHSLPTGYIDFKKYLSNSIRVNEGMEISDECIILPEIPKPSYPHIMIKGELKTDYENEKKIVYWLIDDVAREKRDMKWGDFENYLGQLRVEKAIEKWKGDEFDIQYLKNSIVSITGFFFEWINTIDLSEAKKKEKYLSIINKKNDIAISFNYTETLESLYEMKSQNICYIHGQRETDPVLQHEKSMSSLGKDNSDLVVGFDKKYLTNNTRKSILTPLYKNTTSIIYHYKDFFDSIATSEIKEIYSLGFSFSDVDMPYIIKICDSLKRKQGIKKVTWYITPYGNFLSQIREELHMRKCIWNAGFRGRVRKVKWCK